MSRTLALKLLACTASTKYGTCQKPDAEQQRRAGENHVETAVEPRRLGGLKCPHGCEAGHIFAHPEYELVEPNEALTRRSVDLNSRGRTKRSWRSVDRWSTHGASLGEAIVPVGQPTARKKGQQKPFASCFACL